MSEAYGTVLYASTLSSVIRTAHAHADGFHFDLGELPTWLGVLAASVAAYFVYRQLDWQRQADGPLWI